MGGTRGPAGGHLGAMRMQPPAPGALAQRARALPKGARADADVLPQL